MAVQRASDWRAETEHDSVNQERAEPMGSGSNIHRRTDPRLPMVGEQDWWWRWRCSPFSCRIPGFLTPAKCPGHPQRTGP